MPLVLQMVKLLPHAVPLFLPGDPQYTKNRKDLKKKRRLLPASLRKPVQKLKPKEDRLDDGFRAPKYSRVTSTVE